MVPDTKATSGTYTCTPSGYLVKLGSILLDPWQKMKILTIPPKQYFWCKKVGIVIAMPVFSCLGYTPDGFESFTEAWVMAKGTFLEIGRAADVTFEMSLYCMLSRNLHKNIWLWWVHILFAECQSDQQKEMFVGMQQEKECLDRSHTGISV